MHTNFKMLAKTFFSFEELLENELKQLGAQNVVKGNRVVHFLETKDLCIRPIYVCVPP